MATSRAFDFGPTGAPVMAGYIGTGTQAYGAARGYGWQNSATLTARDLGVGNALARDFVSGSSGTFLVNLENGTYDVTVTLGDAWHAHDQIALFAEGQRVASGLNTAVGQTLVRTYSVPVVDGQLSLRLASEGGANRTFAINALQVASRATAPLTVTAGASISAPVGTTVTLDATAASGTGPYTFAWDLDGSGRYATAGKTVSNFIPEVKTFPISVRATDATGAVATASTSVTGTGVAPVASIIGTYSVEAGNGVTFQSSVTDANAGAASAGFDYTWDFGDGTATASGSGLAAPTHVYAAQGAYQVRMTAKDRYGLVSAPATATVTVNAGQGHPTDPTDPTDPMDPADPSDPMDPADPMDPGDGIVAGSDVIPDFGANPTLVSATSGPWSSPSTWAGGRLPVAGDIINIAAGTSVTYDVASATPYRTVEILSGGALRFRTDVNTKLVVGNFVVLAGGTLEIGTPERPVAPGVTANVVIADQAIDTAKDPSQFGTGLIGLGKVTISGSTKTPTFVRLAAEPRAGDTTLRVSVPVAGWRAGDRLVLPDSRQLGDGIQDGDTRYEETVTLAGVSADGTVLTLSGALRYGHPGARDMDGKLDFLPHVNNVTRNVVIESQNPDGTRGHTMFMDRADVDIRFAGFRNLGRTTNDVLDSTTFGANGNVTRIGTNQIGRYPIHIHHLPGPAQTPANGYQFTLLGDSVENDPGKARKWGVAIHDSSYGLIRDNVVFNVDGAGILTESGDEIRNVFDRNSVVLVSGNASPGDGREGAGFWFRGPDNFVTNNVTSGTRSSYGFEYFQNYVGRVSVPAFAGAGMGQRVSKDMNAAPILSFVGNESYGATLTGLSYYWLGASFITPKATGTSTFKDFSAWNVTQYGVSSYESSDVTIDGLKVRGDAGRLGYILGGPSGITFSDYYTRNFVLTNADIQGMRIGLTLPTLSEGVQTIEKSYLRNYNNVVAGTMWNVSADVGWLPARTTYLRDVVFDTRGFSPLNGVPPSAIAMQYNAREGNNVTQSDRLFVVNYNRVAGDDFQVYYEQQDADFVVPLSILNGDGSPRMKGAPEAGLTNQQAWDKYGVAVAGAVAPRTATRRTGIRGLTSR